MRRALVLFAAAFMLAGSGATSSSDASSPPESPGRAMGRLAQHVRRRQRANSYARLVKEKRKAVGHGLFVRCAPGRPREDVRVLILGVRDEMFDVPAIGRVPTKAVTYEMSIPGAKGDRMRTTDTGHLVAQ